MVTRNGAENIDTIGLLAKRQPSPIHDLRVHRDSLEMTQTLISPKYMAWGPMTHSPDSGA